MTNLSSSSQKDKLILLKVIDTPFIPYGLEELFSITKFTPLFLCNIAKDNSSKEKMKTLNDLLFEKGDAVDASVDP